MEIAKVITICEVLFSTSGHSFHQRDPGSAVISNTITTITITPITITPITITIDTAPITSKKKKHLLQVREMKDEHIGR